MVKKFLIRRSIIPGSKKIGIIKKCNCKWWVVASCVLLFSNLFTFIQEKRAEPHEKNEARQLTSMFDLNPKKEITNELKIQNKPKNQLKMKKFYVNKMAQTNKDHEVHNIDCRYLPKPEGRIYLGEFVTCHGAVSEAKKYFANADGCYYCSKECHNH